MPSVHNLFAPKLRYIAATTPKATAPASGTPAPAAPSDEDKKLLAGVMALYQAAPEIAEKHYKHVYDALKANLPRPSFSPGPDLDTLMAELQKDQATFLADPTQHQQARDFQAMLIAHASMNDEGQASAAFTSQEVMRLLQAHGTQATFDAIKDQPANDQFFTELKKLLPGRLDILLVRDTTRDSYNKSHQAHNAPEFKSIAEVYKMLVQQPSTTSTTTSLDTLQAAFCAAAQCKTEPTRDHWLRQIGKGGVNLLASPLTAPVKSLSYAARAAQNAFDGTNTAIQKQEQEHTTKYLTASGVAHRQARRALLSTFTGLTKKIDAASHDTLASALSFTYHWAQGIGETQTAEGVDVIQTLQDALAQTPVILDDLKAALKHILPDAHAEQLATHYQNNPKTVGAFLSQAATCAQVTLALAPTMHEGSAKTQFVESAKEKIANADYTNTAVQALVEQTFKLLFLTRDDTTPKPVPADFAGITDEHIQQMVDILTPRVDGVIGKKHVSFLSDEAEYRRAEAQTLPQELLAFYKHRLENMKKKAAQEAAAAAANTTGPSTATVTRA